MKEKITFTEIFFAIVIAVVILMSLVLIGRGVQVSGVNAGAVLLALTISYLLFCFGTVEVGEAAAKFFFGAPQGNLEPGLYFAPPGIMSVRKEKATQNQDELPAAPDLIWRGDEDKEKLPPGMSHPIRIKFGGPSKDDDESLKRDPYNIEMVAETPLVVSWRISDATLFFTNYEDIEAFRKILEDKAVEVFGNKFASITPAKASRVMGATSAELEAKLRAETADTGVTINDAFGKPFIYSHPLNTAVVGVSIAKRNAEAVKETAAGERARLAEEGAGKAEAFRLMLEAKAIGAKKLAEVAGTPEGQMTLWMETMSKAFTEAQYSIVPGTEMFTAFAGISEAVKNIKVGEKKK